MKSKHDLLTILNSFLGFDTALKEKIPLETIFSALADYENWLQEVVSLFPGKKDYSDLHIAEQIYTKAPLSKASSKYHVLAIKQCAKDIKHELIEAQNELSINEDFIKGKLALLRDIVLDSYEFIGKCEKFCFQQEITHSLQRRRKFSSNEIFDCSENVLRRHIDYHDISLSSVSVFLIRQAIETKVLNSLGIHAIVDSEKKNLKLKIEKIIEFITSNENIDFPIPKSILLKISKWSNYYIHSGIMHYHWQIMWAHKVLLPVFSQGTGKTIWSIYGAVKIDKNYYEKQFEQELLTYLKRPDAQIIKLRPEAIVE